MNPKAIARGWFSELSEAVRKHDGWLNPFTGFGTARDRTTHSTFQTDVAIDDVELSALYHHNGFAKKIAEAMPRTALFQGVEIESADTKAERTVAKWLEDLKAVEAVQEGAIWGRAFGGGVVLLGVDDGRSATEPLDLRNVKSFDFLETFDRRDVSVHTWSRNRAGEPLIYYINGPFGSGGPVHRSRLLVFGGARTAKREREMLGGWDYSVFQACYDSLKQAGSVYNAAHLMVTDASQGVFKMKGLFSAIAGGNIKDIITRAHVLDATRSVARSIMLDADYGEDFRKEQTSFSGIPDTMIQFVNKLAADSETPVTVLMGQAPAGLNATGESDLRVWYDNIQSVRQDRLLPALLRIVDIVRAVERIKSDVTLSFPSLWQMTPKEEAELRTQIAQHDAVYHAMGVPAEAIVRNRFGGRKWSMETRLEPHEMEGFPDPAEYPEDVVYGA